MYALFSLQKETVPSRKNNGNNNTNNNNSNNNKLSVIWLLRSRHKKYPLNKAHACQLLLSRLV